MRKVLVTTLLVAATVGSQAQVKNQSHGYPIDPVPFTSVKVTDSFWGQRLNASREVTIPLAFSKCEETGRYQNFVNAAHPSDTIKVGGLAFDDTDVYKTIEGASYLLQTYPDKKLAKYIDSVLVIVAAAQEPDGYLYTSRTMNPKHPHEWAGSKRWEKGRRPKPRVLQPRAHGGRRHRPLPGHRKEELPQYRHPICRLRMP